MIKVKLTRAQGSVRFVRSSSTGLDRRLADPESKSINPPLTTRILVDTTAVNRALSTSASDEPQALKSFVVKSIKTLLYMSMKEILARSSLRTILLNHCSQTLSIRKMDLASWEASRHPRLSCPAAADFHSCRPRGSLRARRVRCRAADPSQRHDSCFARDLLVAAWPPAIRPHAAFAFGSRVAMRIGALVRQGGKHSDTGETPAP